MVTTRGIVTVAPNQTDKTTTINDQAQALEDIFSASQAYTVTGTFTVSATEWIGAIRYRLNGTPAGAFNMRLPATSRLILVDNASGQTATVGVDPGEDGFDGTTVTVADGVRSIIYSDGTDCFEFVNSTSGGLHDGTESTVAAATGDKVLALDVSNSDAAVILTAQSIADLNGSGGSWTENAQTGTSYTLALSDAGKVVTMNNASANTLTIPTNAAVAFSVGTWVRVIQEGAGITTIDEGSATLQGDGVTAGAIAIAARYGGAVLWKKGTNDWRIEGNLS